jgi:hypothetical protein
VVEDGQPIRTATKENNMASQRVKDLERIRGEAWNAYTQFSLETEEGRNAMYQYMALTAMRDADIEAFKEAVKFLNEPKTLTFDWERGFKD